MSVYVCECVVIHFITLQKWQIANKYISNIPSFFLSSSFLPLSSSSLPPSFLPTFFPSFLLSLQQECITSKILELICQRLMFMKVKVKVDQSCPTLCNPMDYTIHGILQARILEWIAFPFSRRSSQPRDQTQVSCTAGGFFTSWATMKAHVVHKPR